MSEVEADKKLEVFISYSRRDSTVFADQLDKSLQAFGFKTVLDRHQISGGEDWQKRLGALILSAETVVFVLSPLSAVSEICLWEIEEAQRLHKRILPVVAQPLGAAKAPSGLQKLNYTHFYDEPSVPGSGFGDGIAKLVTALNSDLDWLREHARLQELAERWSLGQRHQDRLLSGSAIAEALDWLKARPKTAPDPTFLQLEFLSASEARANEEADRREAELAEREALAAKAEAAAREQQEAARKAEAEAKRAEDALAAVKIEQARTAKTQRRLFWTLGAGAMAVAVGLFAAWWMQYQTILREAVVLTSAAQKAIDEQHYDRAMRIALQGLPHPGSGWLTPGWDTKEMRGLEAKLAGAAQGSPLKSVLRGHQEIVVDAQFSPDGKKVVTASWDDSARVWNAETGQEIAVLQGHEADVNSARFSPDGSLIVTASDDGSARVCDTETGRLIHKLEGHEAELYQAEFDESGKRVVTASSDKTARVWDLSTGNAVVLKGHNGDLSMASFIPGGTMVVTASNDGSAGIWDARTGELIASCHHAKSVWTARPSAGGERIITASEDRSVSIWNTKSCSPIVNLKGHTRDVNSALFNPDGTVAISVSDDHTVRIWDLKTQVATTLRHKAAIKAVAISRDGQSIVTGSDDMTAALWDMQGRELARLSGHDGIVRNASFSPDGRFVVTASDDGTARVWMMPHWAIDLRHNELRDQVCAEKLNGAQEFTEADATDPIIAGLAGRNPCLARGPLSAYYWSGISTWMSQQIARWRGTPAGQDVRE